MVMTVEERKAKKKKYREANKEKMQKYREANKEKIKEQARKYYEANKEAIKEQMQKYREANKEAINQKASEWRKNNPLKNTKNFVRSHLRKQLGEEPPEIVVEILALKRLIGRECKKRGA